jgi:hypothetical protein
MKLSTIILIFGLLLQGSAALFAQFQVRIPRAKISAVTRINDTLYFWAENHVWKSTDWGLSAQPIAELSTQEEEIAGSTGSYGVSNYTVRSKMSQPIPEAFRHITVITWTNLNKDVHSNAFFPPNESIAKWSEWFYQPVTERSEIPEVASVMSSHVSTNGLFSYGFRFLNSQGELVFRENIQFPIRPDFKIIKDSVAFGFFNDSIALVDFRDTSMVLVKTPFPQPNNQLGFLSLSPHLVALENKVTGEVALWNTQSKSLSGQTSFPIHHGSVRIGQWGSEFLAVRNDSVFYMDILSQEVHYLPLAWPLPAGERLVFLGKNHLVRIHADESAMNLSRNLGADWEYRPSIGLYTHTFGELFDHGDTLYALREQELFVVPKNTATELMQFRNRTSGPIFNQHRSLPNEFGNFGKRLMYKNLYSDDFGLTWDSIEVPFLPNFAGRSSFSVENTCFDWTTGTLYHGLPSSIPNQNIYHLRRLNIPGGTWETIQTPISPGFREILAMGDTLFIGKFVSFDKGASWLPFVPDSATQQGSFWTADILKEKIVISKHGNQTRFQSNDWQGNFLETLPSLFLEALSSHVRLKHQIGVTRTFTPSGPHFHSKNALNNFGNRRIVGLETPRSVYQHLGGFEGHEVDRLGVADNYLYIGDTIYPLSNHQITLHTCDSIEYQNRYYTEGWYPLSGTAFQPDTLLYVKKVPLERRQVGITACLGDTLVLGSKTVVANSSYMTILDTVYTHSPAPPCGEILHYSITSHIQSKNSTVFLCPGDTLNLYGNIVHRDTTIKVQIPGLRPACDTLLTIQVRKVHPTQLLSYQPKVYKCEGEIFISPQGDTLTSTTVLLENTLPSLLYGCDSNIYQTIQFLPTRDTLTFIPITFCEGDSALFQGNHYTTSTDVVRYVQNGTSHCRQTVQPIIANPLTLDTLPVQKFCQELGFIVGNTQYFSDTLVAYSTTYCANNFLPLVALPVLQIELDTVGVDSMELFGQVYYTDTAFVQQVSYSDAACDSLRFLVRIHLSLSNTELPHPLSMNVEVFPNPSSGLVTVKWPGTASVQLQVIDSQGRTLGQFEGQSPRVMDLSQLPQGVYLIKVIQADGTFYSRKLVLKG